MPISRSFNGGHNLLDFTVLPQLSQKVNNLTKYEIKKEVSRVEGEEREVARGGVSKIACIW